MATTEQASDEAADTAQDAATGDRTGDPASDERATGDVAVRRDGGNGSVDGSAGASFEADEAPETLAFTEAQTASIEFCNASASVWVQIEALTAVGDRANAELTEIALIRIGEKLERSTLFADDDVEPRVQLFGAFKELRAIARAEFGNDWNRFRQTESFADSPAGALYEMKYDELARFLEDDCVGVAPAGLDAEIEGAALALLVGWGTEASEVVPSDSLPGHSNFTHTSGRLIATFPSSWEYRELQGDAIVDFVTARDVDALLAGEAVEGAHIRLVAAGSLDEFRALIDASATAERCVLIDEIVAPGRVLQITQDRACADHAAVIEGRYDETRKSGLIVEAGFKGTEATSAQLGRLADILQSILWS